MSIDLMRILGLALRAEHAWQHGTHYCLRIWGSGRGVSMTFFKETWFVWHQKWHNFPYQVIKNWSNPWSLFSSRGCSCHWWVLLGSRFGLQQHSAPKLPAARSAQSGVLAELLHDLELLSKSGVLRREEIPMEIFAFAIIFQTVCKSLSLFWGISMLSLFNSFFLTSWSWKNSRSLVRLQHPTSHRGTTRKSSRHDEHAFESILRPHPIASRCLPAWHQVDKPQFPTSKYHTILYAIYGSESNTSISIHQ